VPVTGISTAAAVAAGGGHTCSLLADRSVRCWGWNYSGQLGDRIWTNSTVPVPVTGLTASTSPTDTLPKDGTPGESWRLALIGLSAFLASLLGLRAHGSSPGRPR